MADPFTAAMTGFTGVMGAYNSSKEAEYKEAQQKKTQWETLGSMVQDYAAAGDDPEAQKVVDAKANFLLKGFGIKGGDAKDYMNMLRSSGKEQLTGLYNKMFEMGVDPNSIKPGDYFKLPRADQMKMLEGTAERQALTSTVQPGALATPRTGSQPGMPITGLPMEAPGALPGGMPNAASVPLPPMPTMGQIANPPVSAAPLAPPAGPDTIQAPAPMGGDQATKKILGPDGQPVVVPAVTGGAPAGARPARAPDEVLPERAAPSSPITPAGEIHSPYTGNVQNLQLAMANTPAMQNVRDSLKLRSQAEQLEAKAASLPAGSEGAAALVKRAEELRKQAKASETNANIPLAGEQANQYLGGALTGKKGAILNVNLMNGTATLTAPGEAEHRILPRSHPAYEGKDPGTIIGLNAVTNKPEELIKGSPKETLYTDEERQRLNLPEGYGYKEDIQGRRTPKKIIEPDERMQSQAKMDSEELKRIRGNQQQAITQSNNNRYTMDLIRRWGTGTFSPARETIGQVATSLGVPESVVEKTVGNPALAEALQAQFALQTLGAFRNPQGQTNIPGTSSDRETGIVTASVNNLVRTEKGNQLILEAAEWKNDAHKRVASALEQWRKDNGTNLDKPAKSGAYKGKNWYEAREDIENKAAALPESLLQRIQSEGSPEYKRDILPLLDKGIEKLGQADIDILAKNANMLTPAQAQKAKERYLQLRQGK